MDTPPSIAFADGGPPPTLSASTDGGNTVCNAGLDATALVNLYVSDTDAPTDTAGTAITTVMHWSAWDGSGQAEMVTNGDYRIFQFGPFNVTDPNLSLTWWVTATDATGNVSSTATFTIGVVPCAPPPPPPTDAPPSIAYGGSTPAEILGATQNGEYACNSTKPITTVVSLSISDMDVPYDTPVGNIRVEIHWSGMGNDGSAPMTFDGTYWRYTIGPFYYSGTLTWWVVATDATGLTTQLGPHTITIEGECPIIK